MRSGLNCPLLQLKRNLQHTERHELNQLNDQQPSLDSRQKAVSLDAIVGHRRGIVDLDTRRKSCLILQFSGKGKGVKMYLFTKTQRHHFLQFKKERC